MRGSGGRRSAGRAPPHCACSAMAHVRGAQWPPGRAAGAREQLRSGSGAGGDPRGDRGDLAEREGEAG